MRASKLIKLLQYSIDSFGDLDVLADHNIDNDPTTVKLYGAHNNNADAKCEYLTILVDDEAFPSRDSMGICAFVEVTS